MQFSYKPRISDQILKKYLSVMGGVLIQGPKWCGKTTSAAQQAKSAFYLDAPGAQTPYNLANLSPASALNGEAPRLLDEWQLVPKMWDAVRYAIDRRGLPGQFILTGSAVPPDKSEIAHSGAGRIAFLTMRTMSLFESGESNGMVRLSGLFDPSYEISAQNKLSIEEIAFLICRGGWPSTAGKGKGNELLVPANQYLEAIVQSDLSRVDGVKRDADVARSLLHSYARNLGSQASLGTILADMNGPGRNISEATASSYINALKNIFVIEESPAWNPNLRSKTAIRTSPTRYLADPSIAAAALGAGPGDLLNDLNTMGLIFESMAVRDLRVYANALDGSISHYRDKSGLECDAVVHLPNGKYGLVEVKLGSEILVEEGASNLLKLAGKIDQGRMAAPSFMMVLTALGPFAYRRQDGVCVVPIGCLGP